MQEHAPQKGKPARKGSWPTASVIWLFGATLASLAWVGLAVSFLAGQEPGCAVTSWRACFEKVGDWGDFWAGTFSPLAFLWLVVAVILQRAELALTRREFEDNRAVAKEQAEESRRQATFIGKQTDILVEQEEQRAADQAKKQFDGAVEVLAARLLNYDHIWTFFGASADLVGRGLSFRLEDYEGGSDQRIVIGTGQELRSSLRQLKLSAMSQMEARYPVDFVRVYRSVLACITAQDALEGAALTIAKNLELRNLRLNMERLVNMTPNLTDAFNTDGDLDD
ncbi:hypothetical protein ASE04_27420 [Rhizobium sp. Root708]|uniref:hypothetical protein n=1 Tax=Rhizobium sp. Root708 TaxID=1736592 RepID=UPI0006F87229|nr:hypothetical protein [Rhizobium sp. Root708]KRB58447.1 hypothetical protein ASE04_27420 [Rhizobium sp. Root708]